MSTDTDETKLKCNFEDYIRQPERFGANDDNDKEYCGSSEDDIQFVNEEDKNFEDGIRKPRTWNNSEDDKETKEESSASDRIGDGENFDDHSRKPREFGNRNGTGKINFLVYKEHEDDNSLIISDFDDRIIFPEDDVYIAVEKEKIRKESDGDVDERQDDDIIIFPND